MRPFEPRIESGDQDDESCDVNQGRSDDHGRSDGDLPTKQYLIPPICYCCRATVLADISQITFGFMAIIPKLRYRWNGFPSAGIRRPDLGDLDVSETHLVIFLAI